MIYLAGWLKESMTKEYESWKKSDNAAKSLNCYGIKDKKKYAGREGTLMSVVYSCVCEGKSKLFLASADGQNVYAYNGEYYEMIEGKPEKFLKEVIRRTFREFKISLLYQTDTAYMIAKECMETVTSSDEYLYEPNRRYIAFTNGILDLDKKQLKDFDTRYKPFIALDIPYMTDKDSRQEFDKLYGYDRYKNPAQLWEWKIGEIIPNAEMRDAFQMFCGSLLANREEVKIEYVCYLIGSGSNGKSVLASAIAGVFGEQYFSRFTPKQLFKDSDARVNIAALQGKIANLVGDLEDADFAGGDFKRFASGEKFQGRKNYKDPIQVAAPPLLCCTNSMPETSDDSWGHHRRQLPIYTTRHQFTEEDKDPYLTQKLTTPHARQYIFQWIYEGYRKIMRNGGNIILGKSVKEAQRILQEDSSPIRRWWRDRGYFVGQVKSAKGRAWMSLKDLYVDYCAYAAETGSEPKKNTDIANMIRSMGCTIENGGEKRVGGPTFFLVGRKDD